MLEERGVVTSRDGWLIAGLGMKETILEASGQGDRGRISCGLRTGHAHLPFGIGLKFAA